MISVSAPGKLYIAGEYAVVEPGHEAVLVAVDRFITVEVSPAEGIGRIHSARYASGSRTWRRRPADGMIEVDGRARDAADYVVSAIRIVENLVLETGGSLRFFDLRILSELDESDGRKFGLGSSSAVTVATVRAVARFYDLPLVDMWVYKLAWLATDAVQPVGSGGDIAASAFTGWISYRSPERDWLRRARGSTPVLELVGMPWPGAAIRRLPSPTMRLQVGWSGAPASTPQLVASVRAGARAAAYDDFLQGSRACLSGLVEALEVDDTPGIDRAIRTNRRLLKDLGRASGITIETAGLTRLVEIAHEAGAPAKSSGAGGGDCGIALCPPRCDVAAMRSAWRAAGIRPLDLSVHHGPQAES